MTGQRTRRGRKAIAGLFFGALAAIAVAGYALGGFGFGSDVGTTAVAAYEENVANQAP